MEKISTKSNREKYILTAISVFALASVGYAVYQSIQLSNARDENSQLKSSIEDTKKQLQKEKQLSAKANEDAAKSETGSTSGIKPTTSAEPSRLDNNFVALLPHGGFLASQPAITFEWATHTDAAKYVVEIKRLGQADYPSTYPPENIVVTDSSQNHETLSLKKTLQPGDYVWRVTAIATQNGQDTTLQSTEDRNYQVR